MARRLLIVESDRASMLAMRDFFEGLECEVDVARERSEAENRLAHSAYDAVVTDLRLEGAPNHDGLAVVSAARRAVGDGMVVMLTAFGSKPVERRALACGADRFIQKPIGLPLLARILFEPRFADGSPPGHVVV